MMLPNWSALEQDLTESDTLRIIDYAKVRERQYMIFMEMLQNAIDGEDVDWVLVRDIIEYEESEEIE